MKIELQEKDKQIEELKRNVRMSRQTENDTEIMAYMDECMRLRDLLEQTMIQNNALSSQQTNQQIQDEGAVEDQNRLQEALYV